MNYLKNFACLVMAVVAMLQLSACNDALDNGVQNQYYYNYATIIGNETSGYTFVLDDGLKCDFNGTFTPSSLKGWRRAYTYFSFDTKDLDLEKKTVKGTLLSAEKVEIFNLLSEEEATEKKVLDTDSVFTINAIEGIWSASGYLNTIYNTPYVYGVRPTSTLYYNEEELNQSDTLKLHMAVNRHSTGSIYGSGRTLDCFLIEQFYERYSYKDSLIVTIYPSGIKPVSAKIASKDMLTPERKGL